MARSTDKVPSSKAARGEPTPTLYHDTRKGVASSAHTLTDAASFDPDNPPMTDDELAGAFRPGSIRVFRESQGLSQSQFAKRYGINVRTLQDWEQRRTLPDQVAKTYLRLLMHAPGAVAHLVEDMEAVAMARYRLNEARVPHAGDRSADA